MKRPALLTQEGHSPTEAVGAETPKLPGRSKPHREAWFELMSWWTLKSRIMGSPEYDAVLWRSMVEKSLIAPSEVWGHSWGWGFMILHADWSHTQYMRACSTMTWGANVPTFDSRPLSSRKYPVTSLSSGATGVRGGQWVRQWWQKLLSPGHKRSSQSSGNRSGSLEGLMWKLNTLCSLKAADERTPDAGRLRAGGGM